MTSRMVVGAPVLLAGALLWLAGCATTPVRTSGERPSAKARGPEIIVHAGGRTHYFENRAPHCLAYALPGDWDFAAPEAALRAAAGDRIVRVALYSHPSSGDGVTQTLAFLIADVEKDWSAPVPSTIEPLPAARPGALLLRFEEVIVTPATAGRLIGNTPLAVGQKVRLPMRIVAPFVPGFTLVATVYEVEDAREILATLEVTDEPQCWRSVIRKRFPGVLS